MANRIVRLRLGAGMFHDPDTGFRIKTNEEKPLPEPIGDLTRRWLNAGGLVFCEPVESSTVEPEPVADAPVEDVPDEPVEDAPGSEEKTPVESTEEDEAAKIKDLVMGNNIEALRKMCFDMNIKFDKRHSAKTLAKMILAGM